MSGRKRFKYFRAYRVRPKDRFGEVSALFDFVRRNQFTRETSFGWSCCILHAACWSSRAGDCDDMTILLGSMLLATGHPVRLILAGFRPNKPHAYSHIYPEVNVRGRWIAIDATVDHPMGWAPPAIWKRVCEIQKEDILCSPKIP